MLGGASAVVGGGLRCSVWCSAVLSGASVLVGGGQRGAGRVLRSWRWLAVACAWPGARRAAAAERAAVGPPRCSGGGLAVNKAVHTTDTYDTRLGPHIESHTPHAAGSRESGRAFSILCFDFCVYVHVHVPVHNGNLVFAQLYISELCIVSRVVLSRRL